MPVVSAFLKRYLLLAFAAALYSSGAIAQIEKADASKLQDIAHANIAEIETGKLASSQTKNASVREFAQMMVKEHVKALGEVRKLAAEKKVMLPSTPDAMHKAAILQFRGLRGDRFDKQYVKQAGVGDHEATEKLLIKTQAEAKDADVKALAQVMLPVVQAHLTHARQLASAEK